MRHEAVNRQSPVSLGFLVTSVFAATATELLKLQPVRRGFLIFCRCVVAALAVSALERNVVARHNFLTYFR